jgi:hypothetical protein
MKWLSILELPSGSLRTRTWGVNSKRGALLGYIEWLPAWRQYVFIPSPDTEYSHECLSDLAGFLKDRTREHFAALKAKEPAR